MGHDKIIGVGLTVYPSRGALGVVGVTGVNFMKMTILYRAPLRRRDSGEICSQEMSAEKN